MEPPTEDKQWAAKYLLGPLTAPEPSEETGPGSHFKRPIDRASSTSKGSKPSTIEKTSTSSTYPTPPASASPTQSSFHPSNPFSPSHRQTAFGAYPNTGSSQKSSDEPIGHSKGHRRGSSLGEKFPGDMSHRPLDQLRKEARAADRAPHLKKKHIPGADTIDTLDKSTVFGAYHHEGPYDATLLSRNAGIEYSPIEAVRGTNNEALKATPAEYVRDALDKHVPLQGTAVISPGMAGLDGKTMKYEEGADLMREADAPGGAYRRYDGLKYLPEDYKGKGEPSFSIEKALKENPSRVDGIDGNSYEMQSRPTANRQRSVSGSNAELLGTTKIGNNPMKYSEYESGMRRSNTTGRRIISDGLKRRLGSLRKSKKTAEV